MTTQRLISVLTAGSLALMVTGCSTDDTTDATLSGVSPITPASSPDSDGPAHPQSPDKADAVAAPPASADDPAVGASSSETTEEGKVDTTPARANDLSLIHI